jgi:hypothetical protein
VILNLPTMLLLFVAGLVLVLGLGLGGTAGLLALFPGEEEIPGEPPPGWRRSADAALHAGVRVALVLVGLAWPLLYLVLHSYVPRIPGAMCIYGVTQVDPGLVHGVEIAWPVALLALTLGLLLDRVDREAVGAPNRQRNRGVFWLAGACLVFAAWQTIRFLLVDKGGATVSCCTTARDIAPGPGFFQYLGLSLLTEQPTLTPYLASSAGLLLLLTLAGGLGRRLPPVALSPLALLLAAAAGVTTLVTLEGMFGAVSPRLLGLPFHHCLYCVMTEFVDAPLFLGAALGSALTSALAAGVASLADAGSSPPAQRWTVALWRLGAVLLACSLVMVGVHLIVAELR